MVKNLFIAILVMTFVSVSMAAPINIISATKGRPSSESGDPHLAVSTFVGFLKCSSNTTEVETLKCIRRYFTPETSNAMILRYSEALQIAKEYSEPYSCDDKTKKRVEIFEEKDYDFYLCFQSSMVSNTEKPGVVYFKKSDGKPKMTRLQM